MNARPALFSGDELAAMDSPFEPLVTGADLESLIALANFAMGNDLEGVTLRMHSPHDLDADEDDRDPLTPGVRRLTLSIEHPAGLLGVEDSASVVLVCRLFIVGKGPNLQLDAERVLRWVARVERANFAAFSAAGDISNPDIVRTLVEDKLAAQGVADELAAGGNETNRVADEVRAAVANPRTWSPIRADDIVAAWCSLRRLPRATA